MGDILHELEDGYKCLLTFHAGAVALKAYEFTPPSVDGGEGIHQTTFRNTEWHTQTPQHLKKSGDMKENCAYAPADLDTIFGMINQNQKISWLWPDGYYGQVWGWIRSIVPSQLVIGGRPSVEITIVLSNLTNGGIEASPLFGVTTTTA